MLCAEQCADVAQVHVLMLQGMDVQQGMKRVSVEQVMVACAPVANAALHLQSCASPAYRLRKHAATAGQLAAPDMYYGTVAGKTAVLEQLYLHSMYISSEHKQHLDS